MATVTNGIATKSDCNTKWTGQFTGLASALTKTATCSEVTGTTNLWISGNTYTANQCVLYEDIYTKTGTTQRTFVFRIVNKTSNSLTLSTSHYVTYGVGALPITQEVLWGSGTYGLDQTFTFYVPATTTIAAGGSYSFPSATKSMAYPNHYKTIPTGVTQHVLCYVPYTSNVYCRLSTSASLAMTSLGSGKYRYTITNSKGNFGLTWDNSIFPNLVEIDRTVTVTISIGGTS